MDVQTNLQKIKDKIGQACEKSNRNIEDITIIGVTKYVTIERAEEAIEAGITNLGENRNEGFLEKYNKLTNKATWHFIGSLQTRKVKDIIDNIDYLHSLDRESLAKEVNKRATAPVNCFVQVNVSGEESKHGMEPEEVLPFIENLRVYENIHIVGLMTMAPHIDDSEKIRGYFRKLANLRDIIKDKNFKHAPCTFLSMGMSNDFEIAIEEGATHIRIGTSLVG
ncbi:YggS family pyridoxal phosphate-dependent enzyme [Oceanobacillus piezotolerans]|uniref:Pyridoxal phosphate homeostasis protein n=1 Tax=Oceanobacillus piezotolerans TaxID=2448030 RepID=A0A498D723_9BACI|nr:YggS family pyridoxal phosphate-dependent enzyme [Oceanobacillus piezotolerans]RLL45246.1 YggS family pyridoxal phosphate-dependent enzyme [Oceanobacillus piezotolerans]